MSAIIVLGALVLVGVSVFFNTRPARLKRLARRSGLQYTPYLDQVLTETEFCQSFFRGQGSHHFFHILTWKDAGAFIRMSDDRVTLVEDKQSRVYSVITAELTRGCFAPFILMPRRPQEPVFYHPALPKELAEKYLLSAPDDFRFPQAVLGFLKAAVTPCYLELTAHAFIYHEFSLLPLAQLPNIRMRVRQLILSLVHQPTPTRQPGPQAAMAACAVPPTGKMPAAMSEAELQAQILLKLQGASRSYGSPADGGSNAGRWIFAVLFLCVITGMLVFARYALTHWVGR